MMECSCVYVGDTSSGNEFYRSKIVTAKKLHKCCECHKAILPSEKYEYVSQLVEGDFFTHKTCLDCLSVRDEFFCDGWWFENVWEHLTEHINNLSGDISENCIKALTPHARGKVCELIEKTWSYV
jgi:hypothetical protein